MSKNATIWLPTIASGETTLVDTSDLLQESSFSLLTESGFSLLLESVIVENKALSLWTSETKNSSIWRDNGTGEPTIVSDTRITETGDTRITEDSSALESSSISAKATTEWTNE